MTDEYRKTCSKCRKRKRSRVYHALREGKTVWLCQDCWDEEEKAGKQVKALVAALEDELMSNIFLTDERLSALCHTNAVVYNCASLVGHGMTNTEALIQCVLTLVAANNSLTKDLVAHMERNPQPLVVSAEVFDKLKSE